MRPSRKIASEQFSDLPPGAKAAFAALVAERLLPEFEAAASMPDHTRHLASIKNAIEVAWTAAANSQGSRPAEEVAAREATYQIKAAILASKAPADPVNPAWVAAQVAAWAAQIALCVRLHARGVRESDYYASSYAGSVASLAVDFAGPEEAARQAADYERISSLTYQAPVFPRFRNPLAAKEAASAL